MNLREQYNRDGYLVYRDIFTNEFTDTVNRIQFDDWIERYGKDFVPFLRHLSKSMWTQDIFLRSRVLNILSTLLIKGNSISIVEQPVLNFLSSSLRIPDGYYGTEAHQDWASIQGSLDVITVWIPLTDAYIGSFPLEVIPESHKNGLCEGKVNGSILEIECNDKDFVPIECKAGDVVFINGFTIHRTGKGNGLRIAVSQRFYSDGDPTFIERNFYCAQKRVVDREMKWKPTIEQIRGIFNA